MDQLMTVAQLAQYLNVRRATLYRWAYHGVIPAIRLGKLWRFPKTEIDAWIKSNQVQKLTPKSIMSSLPLTLEQFTVE